jgi:hypothetical protein
MLSRVHELSFASPWMRLSQISADGYEDLSASNVVLQLVAELRHGKHDLRGVLVFVADERRFQAFIIVGRDNQRSEMQLGEFDKTYAPLAISDSRI